MDQLSGEIIPLLRQQNQLLQQLIELQTQRQPLGLGPPPGAPVIYCNRTQCPPYLWYRRINGENQGLEYGSLTGYLRRLAVVTTERRGKETNKLHITVEADQHWILECSETSVFAKSFLSALVMLMPEQLQSPIQIVPLPGEDEKVLFCQVWLHGVMVESSQWNSETDFEPIIQTALQLVNQGDETLISTPPLPPEDLSNAERVRLARESVGVEQTLIRDVLLRDYQVKHPDQLTPEACKDLVERIVTRQLN